MGWGDIFKWIGGIAAAPATGGASLILPAISTAGQIASGIGSGRAAGRDAEANRRQQQDYNQIRFDQNRLGFEDSRRADDQNRLRFADFNLAAPQARARNAAKGDLLANVQDVRLTRPRGGGVQGGVRPSVLSPESRALGSQMSRQALISQMQGDLQPSAPGSGLQPNQSTPSPLPQANAFDRILNGIGYAGLIGGGIDALRNKRGQRPTITPGLSRPLSSNVTLPRFG